MKNRLTSIAENAMDNVSKIFALATTLGLDDLHIKFDPNTGLQAIVAIHDTTLGPALGGCRLANYTSAGAAVIDAIRLARGMTLKSALADIPQGGGKAVLIKPSTPFDRTAYFEKFAHFVHELNGRYITAVDSGTMVSDMDLMAKITPYVACTSNPSDNSGNPAPYTAEGVMQGIKAAVKFRFKRDTLEGLHIAIQGVGAVGFDLAQKCHQLGARLTISDVNPVAMQLCAEKTAATIVATEDIHRVACDIFSPCALGASINANTLKQLQCKIVAGAANNQLHDHSDGETLRQLGILYAPDYVINAGGVIYASIVYHHGSAEEIQQKVANIYHTTMEIFQRAGNEHATNVISAQMAEERILRKKAK